MDLQGDLIALALSGAQVKINHCNIAITQPKIKDVVIFGEDQFLFSVQLLSKTDQYFREIKKGNSELEIIPNFNILLIMLEQDRVAKQQVIDFLNFIFPNYTAIEITQTEINFKIETNIVGQINAVNFQDFQFILQLLFLPKMMDRNGEIEYNPEGEKAREITEKILAGRRKLQQQRRAEEQKESLFALYTSILSIGLKMDLNIFMNYTPFQLFDSLNRFFKKNAEDYYSRLSTTPFMDVSKVEAPPSWVENLY